MGDEDVVKCETVLTSSPVPGQTATCWALVQASREWVGVPKACQGSLGSQDNAGLPGRLKGEYRGSLGGQCVPGGRSFSTEFMGVDLQGQASEWGHLPEGQWASML